MRSARLSWHFARSPQLAAMADEAAAKEGLSRSDIARRALLRDLQAAREARTAVLAMGPVQ